MRLIGDLGGTNARFALIDAPGAPPQDIQKFLIKDFPGVVEALHHYLNGRTIDEAVLAVPNPITGDMVRFTNSPWTFSIKGTQATLGLERFAVLNDFVAQALAMPILPADHLNQFGGEEPVRDAPAVVIGAGTGLGVAALVPLQGTYLPIASEGGHVGFPPTDAREAEMALRLQRRFGGHLSNERVLAGPGLVNMALALAEMDGVELGPLTPPDVTARARAGICAYSMEAVRRFSKLLGSAAGDAVLMFCARGGVYVSGGVCLRLGDLFDRESFREGFAAKGRFVEYLAPIPSYLVTHIDPGLIGVAAYRFLNQTNV